MHRISAFAAPSALAASLLLAACAPDSLTGSDSSRVQALADTAATRDQGSVGGDSASAADSSAGAASRESAVAAGSGAGADAPVPGADTGSTATGATGDAAATNAGADTAASGTAVDSAATGIAADTATPAAIGDTATGKVPAEAVSDSGAPADRTREDAADAGAARVLEGAWRRTGHRIEPGIAVDGVLVTDLLMQDAVESRDNLTRFRTGGVWTEDEGPMKSSAGTAQSEDGAWTLDANGNVLSLRPAGVPESERFEFKILELSATTLKVASSSGAYSDGQAHTETITFTRQ